MLLEPKRLPKWNQKRNQNGSQKRACTQELPRGAPGAQNAPHNGAKMHPRAAPRHSKSPEWTPNAQTCSFWALLAAKMVLCDPKMVLKFRNCLKICLLFRMLLDPPKLPALKLEPTDQPTASRGRRDSRRD